MEACDSARALPLEASGVSGSVLAVGNSGEGVREMERGGVVEDEGFVVAVLPVDLMDGANSESEVVVLLGRAADGGEGCSFKCVDLDREGSGR